MSTDAKKRGLGRGLGALIVDTAGNAGTGDAPAGVRTGQGTAGPGVATLPVDALSPNPHQPRTEFDPDALSELAASIVLHGILQPLVVSAATPAGSGDGLPDQAGRYWIVAGERRWRAARLAGLTEVPAIIREASPQQLMEWALVENLQRDDLNPLEEAAAYQSLIAEFGLTQAEVAERVGKSRSAVANTVRLLHLPPAAQQALVAGKVTAGHARALLALPDRPAMESALAEILARDLNVRQAEALVKRMLEAPPAPVTAEAPASTELDAQWRDLEARFRAALSTKVSLTRNQDGSGRLVVHFYNSDDLDAIYRLIARDEADDDDTP